MLRGTLNWIGRKFKGPDYHLDPALPLSALLELAGRRLMWLLRGRVCFPFRRARAFIAPGVTLRNRALLLFDNGITIGQGATIDALSRLGVKLGKNVYIGPYTTIQASGVLTRLGTGCEIGDNSGIGGYSFLGCGGGLNIGANVIMGQYVSFHSENHVIDRIDLPIRAQGVTRQGIVVEDDCWVAANDQVRDGCSLRRLGIQAIGSPFRGGRTLFHHYVHATSNSHSLTT